MTPYINNTPFVNGMGSGNGQKNGNINALHLIGALVVIGGAIGIYYYQKKHFNKIIANLNSENDRLKKGPNT